MENQMNGTKGATATGNFWLLVMVAAGLFANPQMQDVFAQCGGREAGCQLTCWRRLIPRSEIVMFDFGAVFILPIVQNS